MPDLPTPGLVYSMDVNALNYCRFSLLPLSSGEDRDPVALIALPNLVDSSTVRPSFLSNTAILIAPQADIWSLPSQDRVHAAIGQETNKPVFATQPDSGRGSHGKPAIPLHRPPSSPPAQVSSCPSTCTPPHPMKVDHRHLPQRQPPPSASSARTKMAASSFDGT